MKKIRFAITEDALTKKESGYNFPEISVEDVEFLAHLKQNFQRRPWKVDSENCDYFLKLHALRDKYPDNPEILTYLMAGYGHLRMRDQLEELIMRTCEKFPVYLFSQLALASLRLDQGFPEKALEVLKGANTLKELRPRRSVFHISEFRLFERIMVRIFCKTGDFEQANTHVRIMEMVFDKKDPVLRSARWLVKKSKLLFWFKRGYHLFKRSTNG